MSAYRQSAEPEPSQKTIVLPRARALRVILGVCLWFLCFWFLVFPVSWVVDVLATGEGPWRLAVAPPAVLFLVWGIVRLMRLDQVMIGTEHLRRAGFLRDRRVAWEEFRGFEERIRHRARGRSVRLYAIATDHSELLVAPDILADPGAVLRWCLERAKKGELRAIDERVRRDGVRFSPWPRRLTHLGVALMLSVAVGSFIWGPEKRRAAERVFDEASGAPHAEQVALLTSLYDDEGLESRLRCRAGSRLMSGATRRGELERAAAFCEQMAGPIGCGAIPIAPVDCDTAAFALLGRVRAALGDGDPQGALSLLGTLRFQGAFRDTLEIEALRQSGSPAMARVVAEGCVERWGDAEDPAIRAFADRCRGAL